MELRNNELTKKVSLKAYGMTNGYMGKHHFHQEWKWKLYQTHIAKLNPIRYRGYQYDNETGFYYLNSRYHDPEVGRFINADDVIVITLDPTSFYDKNLYEYCRNNPVLYKDTNGYFPDLALDIAFIFGDIASLVSNQKNILGYAELAGDLIGLFLPGITGGGTIARTVVNSENLVDSANLVDNVIDSQKTITSSIELGKDIHKAYNHFSKQMYESINVFCTLPIEKIEKIVKLGAFDIDEINKIRKEYGYSSFLKLNK